MNVIFINRFYSPDQSATSQLLTDLAALLAEAGYDVSVITSRHGHDGSRLSRPADEMIDGVRVRRVWSTSLGHSLFARFFDYSSFYVSAASAILGLARAGTIIVAKTDPPLLSIPAALVAKMRRARLVNWLQDIFPEVATSLVPSRLLRACLWPLRRLRNLSLRGAAMNVVLGEAMSVHLQGEGIAPGRIQIIHNWAPFDTVHPIERADNQLQKDWNLGSQFVVGYSGNMGRAHEFSTLLEAAHLLRNEPDISFVLIGGGHQKGTLRDIVRARKLTNISFRPYQPCAQLSLSLSVPDVHLVSLLPCLEGLIVPSKFYGIAAAARPTIFIGAANGELAQILDNGNCGAVVEVGDGAGLAREIRRLQKDPALCRMWGRNARELTLTRFNRHVALAAWDEILRHAATDSQAALLRDGPRPHAASKAAASIRTHGEM